MEDVCNAVAVAVCNARLAIRWSANILSTTLIQLRHCPLYTLTTDANVFFAAVQAILRHTGTQSVSGWGRE